ncbi:MAG TPA: PEP-CTERM sorting domain-containing protein [Burkholderiales bacterium]|nr:PEP-CTERM sorting domain-containing protein [Burkholderiales bacterium]
MKRTFRRFFTVLILLAAAHGPAQAATWNYAFGTWLANGYGHTGPSLQPEQTFASLSVSTTDWLKFDFTLRAFDAPDGATLASVFGAGAFIAKAVFNSASGADPVSISNIETNGYVGNVYMVTAAPTLGGVGFDFGDCFGSSGPCSNAGPSSGRLESGEWVSWSLTFASRQDPFLGTPPVALNVQAGSKDGLTNAWYTPTSPIPEPETYAMLLAGLGLMGFVARRRRNTLSG